MPNSYKTHTANGSTTLFSFAEIDGWVSTGFIKVYVDNVLQTTGYSLVDLNTATPKVSFTTAPAANSVIVIQRETPSTVSAFQSNVVNFNNGSVLTEEDLDNLAKGLLHVAQEAEDTGGSALNKDTDDNWTASSKRIKNVAEPVAPTDVATRQYVDSITLYGTGVAIPQAWTFSGNGSQTVFAWTDNSQPAPLTTEKNMFLVEVGGVLQPPSVYNCDATNLTFTGGTPAAGTTISVRNIGSNRSVLTFNEPLTVNNSLTCTSAAIDGININNGANNLATNVIVGSGGTALSGSSASKNTYIGNEAGNASTTGSENVLIGYRSGKSLTTGNSNVFVGPEASQGSATTIASVVIGKWAGYNLSNTGGLSVVIGAFAGGAPGGGVSLTNTANSVVIGYGTTFGAASNSNSIIIGANAIGDGANTTVIGTTSTTQTKLHGNLIITGNGTSTFAGGIQVGQTTPGNASDVCRKDYVDSLTRIGATIMLRVNAANNGIESQIGSTFSLSGSSFRATSGTWEGYRMDTAEAKRTVTSSADTGTATIANAVYCFIRTA